MKTSEQRCYIVNKSYMSHVTNLHPSIPLHKAINIRKKLTLTDIQELIELCLKLNTFGSMAMSHIYLWKEKFTVLHMKLKI